MHKVSNHSVPVQKTVEDWLFIAAIVFFYLLIVAMTFFSAYWAFQYLPLAGF